MADKTQMDDEGLSVFFDAAQATRQQASPDLLARVLQDGEDQQMAWAIPIPRATPISRSGFRWRDFGAALGGWPTFAGLATAAVTGVWIGFSAPDAVDDLTAGYLGYSSDPQFSDLMPTLDIFMTEG